MPGLVDEPKRREGYHSRWGGRHDGSGRNLTYEETGLVVTQENRSLIPDVELREFDAKVREYYELIAEDKPNAS